MTSNVSNFAAITCPDHKTASGRKKINRISGAPSVMAVLGT
jgi:hypothetical protein